MPANIVVPEVGESIVDARVAKWLKHEGDTVSAGDPLVELETDKIDLEVAAPKAGVLARIDHQDGADVKVGDVLGVIEEGAAQAGARVRAAAEGAAEGAGGVRTGAEGAAAVKPEGKTRSTPAARKAAEQKAVDLASVKGSGDAGRVMRRDVEAASAPATEKPAAAGRRRRPRRCAARPRRRPRPR